jgi:hypothetical protein
MSAGRASLTGTIDLERIRSAQDGGDLALAGE